VITDTDTYAGAVMYTDIEKQLGPIPMPKAGTTLGFVAKAYENEFWRAVKDGVEAQIKELNDKQIDIKADVRAAQGESDEQGQAALMDDMVNKKYSAIIASPISDGNLVPPTEKAQAQGIPVINAIGGFCNCMDVYVGPKHYMSGEVAAEWIAKKLGDAGGEVAVIMGLPKESAARGRTKGFGDWLAANAPTVKLVDVQNADWDRTKAKDVMDTLLKKHPNLKAVYANNDTMAMGALEAVKAANKLGEVFVIGNDGTTEALKSVKDGELSATVNIYPDFGGKISVDIALRALAGQELPRVIYTNQAIIDPTNVDLPAEEVIGWTGLNLK
jgi:ribose transport system substrate-binding protein